jgi:CBS domain-containing protein
MIPLFITKSIPVMLNQEVRKIMTLNPATASPEQSISEVSEYMLANNIQQMPVTNEGQLVGMITTYDMWKAIRKQQTENSLNVEQVMNDKVIKITPKDKVGTAAELFLDNRFKTLPVVNLRNELKGVITSFDLMRLAIKEEYPRPILYKDAFQSQEAAGSQP